MIWVTVIRLNLNAPSSQAVPKAAERLGWPVDILEVKPNDRLLEIGCGHGVAVSLVCEKLKNGHITAIDRSAKMISLAKKRNADSIAAGKASFQTVSLDQAKFGNTKFDTIFAVRIGAFLHEGAERELEIVRKYLAPKGKFYLVYDPPKPEQAREVMKTAVRVLEAHNFKIEKALTKDIAKTKVVCVIATA
jgi:cyclopropane fatty-acyl-phospholipid synthase-like methyltransferase